MPGMEANRADVWRWAIALAPAAFGVMAPAARRENAKGESPIYGVTTVQIMVKDSKRYAATSGWGLGRFVGGRPVDEAQHETCFGCHEANVKDHDLVVTLFAK